MASGRDDLLRGICMGNQLKGLVMLTLPRSIMALAVAAALVAPAAVAAAQPASDTDGPPDVGEEALAKPISEAEIKLFAGGHGKPPVATTTYTTMLAVPSGWKACYETNC